MKLKKKILIKGRNTQQQENCITNKVNFRFQNFLIFGTEETINLKNFISTFKTRDLDLLILSGLGET